MPCNIIWLTRAQIDNVVSKDFLHTTPHGAMKGKTQRKHNLERFPERFRFQLTDKEKDKTVAICDRFEHIKHSSVNPCVYTEQGVAMLSTVLRSETAVNTGNRIMFGFSLIGKDSVTIIDRVKNLI